MPMPKSIVLITLRSGASELQMKQQCMVFLMLLVRVIAVSMSTRRNMDKFGAPIGSVNCSFINVYNSEQLLYDLQNIIIRDSVHAPCSK